MFRKLAKNFLPIGLSLLLLSLTALLVSPDMAIKDFLTFDLQTTAAVLLLFVCNFLLVSFRLSKFLKYFGMNVSLGVSIKANVQGHVASLYIVSLFGQVAGRYNTLRRHGAAPVFIAALTVVERITLTAVSVTFALIGATYIFGIDKIHGFLSEDVRVEFFFLAAISFLISVCFGRIKFELQLVKIFCKRKRLLQGLEVSLITLLAQGFIIGAFVIAGLSLAPEIDVLKLTAAAAITCFVAALPISVNGWGIREITAVFTFGAIGMPESMALGISILIGLTSTVAVLLFLPYSFYEQRIKNRVDGSFTTLFPSKLILQTNKWVTYFIAISMSIFIFFQFHWQLPGAVINANLADPLAILCLSVTVLNVLSKGRVPQWRIPFVNIYVLILTCLLVFSFFNGLFAVGTTQLVSTGRLFGWLVLLGYLSFGISSISYFNTLITKRFIETLIATSVVIILAVVLTRFLIYAGWINPGMNPVNFEGFSGNRNAFAFQLLTCSVLMLSFADKQNISSLIRIAQFKFQKGKTAVAAHGIILAGIVFTGSKAGMLTGSILLIFAGVTKFTNFNFLKNSIFFGVVFWVIVSLFLPWMITVINELRMSLGASSEVKINAVYHIQSMLSHDASNLERWETIRIGYEMWKGSPWLGIGLGIFKATSSQFFPEETVIHSTPIWVLVEFGIVGALIMLTIFASLLVSIVRTRLRGANDQAVIMLLGVFIIFGLFHEIFYQRIFWLVLGICLAAGQNKRRVSGEFPRL